MKELTSQPIAQGRTAEIYLWDDQHVLKLYRDWCPSNWVEYEAWIARSVHEAGVPSPAVGEIIDVNGRRGLLYERLAGISMLQDMNTRPRTFLKHAHTLAELQVQIHRQSIPGLPSYKDRLDHDLRNTAHLSEDLKDKALARLASLPNDERLCHGDYHPDNIFLTKSGPVVIDWMTACSGSPSADVARTSMILSIGAKAAGKQVSPFIRMAIHLYQRAYLSRYRSLYPDGAEKISRWAPVIAAARLHENIIPEREALIRIVKEGLKE